MTPLSNMVKDLKDLINFYRTWPNATLLQADFRLLEETVRRLERLNDAFNSPE